ncbi:hypothetical protein KC734_05655, partial [candidate division KSB1 bacterium]|nr:hypothetical protein [candidate division KSB1 bacterium]
MAATPSINRANRSTIFFFVVKKEAKNSSAAEIWLNFHHRFLMHLNSLCSNRKCVISEATLKIFYAKFLMPECRKKNCKAKYINPSCDLKETDTVCEHKQENFEFKALCSDRMYRFGKSSFDQAA